MFDVLPVVVFFVVIGVLVWRIARWLHRNREGATMPDEQPYRIGTDAPADIVDVVDRGTVKSLHGVTWHTRWDAALDYIGTLSRDKADALDALMTFLREHPEFEEDEQLLAARLALL